MRSPATLRSPSLTALAETFPKRRVLVVGDLVADHYIYGQTDRVSREAPVLIVRYESAEVKPGAAANAAANVRSLGAHVTVVGLLGRDEMGAELRKQLRARGIKVAAASAPGVQTETKTRILAGGISTTRQQMLRLDRTQTAPLPARLRLELTARIAEAARSADAVVVSDYGAGAVPPEARGVLRKLAREGLPVCVDSRYALHTFQGLTVCKPNEPELAALVGRPLRSRKEILDAAREALGQLQCAALLVTRGRHGMMVITPSGTVDELPVHGAQEAVDVTGAGDTVVAAYALSLAAGASFLDAARMANVAGGLAVMKPGTATVSREELVGELAR